MALKRGSNKDEQLTNPPPQNSKGVCCCRGSANLAQELLTLLRPCIGEEVEQAIKRVLLSMQHSALYSTLRSSPHQAESSAQRRLKLHIVGTLPDVFLTKTYIHESASLRVELCDETGSRIEDGSESSVKVKIEILDGHFDVEDRDDWTEEEFRNNVVQPRDGKPSLLVGQCEFFLCNGVADVSGIKITDNSSGVRSKKFRFGVSVIKGLPSGVVVSTAVSKAFRVKENRLQSQLKHEYPELEDHVWRLNHIAKNGAVCKRLANEKISTVQDLLQLYHADPKKLQNILRVSEKQWMEIVKNAELSQLTNECYQYVDDVKKVYLLLDCVFNIKTVTIMGQNSQPYESLDNYHKDCVDKARVSAYAKRSELPKVCPPTSPLSVAVEPSAQLSTESTLMQWQEASTNEEQNELQNNYVPTNQMPLHTEFMSSTSITDTNLQCFDTGVYYNNNNICEIQNMHAPPNQMSMPAEFDYPSKSTYTNLLCSDDLAADQGIHVNHDSLSPIYSPDVYQHEDLTSQMHVSIESLLIEPVFQPQEESGSTSKISTNEKVTIKLKAAWYVHKAALRFMISAPRKKQRIQ